MASTTARLQCGESGIAVMLHVVVTQDKLCASSCVWRRDWSGEEIREWEEICLAMVRRYKRENQSYLATCETTSTPSRASVSTTACRNAQK